ncbi:MAG: SDR family oxidoreductase [Gaiella sp.]
MSSAPAPKRPTILLTGATGYVGGRLLRALEERGEPVRCLTRRPEAVAPHRDTTTVMAGDVLDLESLRPAMRGVETAYYLVHSMAAAASFEQHDRRAAENFAAAAREAGVRRIVYLGGLGAGSDLSSHLTSRQEVGRILADTGVQTLEFRASIVIGSGSFSFEMLRTLVERLPVMITPRWVRTKAQPIAIEDVLDYLLAALDVELEGNRVFEIGGADQVSFEGLMREYARQLGIRRWIIPVPFLTARLSSLWLGLVTPVYARVGRKLIDSLPHETVVHSAEADRTFPIRPRGYREAIARALVNEDRAFAETRWSDAVCSAGPRPERYGGVRHGKRLVDSRALRVPVTPAQAFRPIRRIGGATGWYFGNPLWRLRGFVDLLAGGVGVRRGRRDPETPAVGSALDFWRVEAYEPDRLLRLRAEMKLPGRAWLQFEVDEDGSGSTIRQTAIFHPTGLLGTAYWYGLFPVHSWIFQGMLKRIADTARTPAQPPGSLPGTRTGADHA